MLASLHAAAQGSKYGGPPIALKICEAPQNFMASCLNGPKNVGYFDFLMCKIDQESKFGRENQIGPFFNIGA